MSISLQLVESNSIITKKIYRGLAKELNTLFNKKQKQLEKNLQNLTRSTLAVSPEILSLQSGKLRADFGLTQDPSTQIINSIVDTLKITIKPVTATANSIKGGISISIQPTDYSNLYALGVSQQLIRGGSLPWLKWLLEAGDSILIVDFGVEYGPYGRTGQARMTENNRPFKVDSNYSGVAEDNFISRTFQRNENSFKQTIIQVIK